MRRSIAGLLVLMVTVGGALGDGFDMTKYNPKRLPGLHSSTREEVCLNGIWKFMPIVEKEYYTGDEFPDPATGPKKDEGKWHDMIIPGMWKERSAGWCGVRLPGGHELPGAWHNVRRGWYTRKLTIPGPWQGKAVILRFNGIAYYGKVFVNGKPQGDHLGPGTPFEFDISSAVEYGKDNTLDVYVIDKRKGLRTPQGISGYRAWGFQVWSMLPEQWEYRREEAGIWKDVFIDARDKAYVDDIFAMPSYRQKKITGRAWIKNASDEPKAYRLTLGILDMAGNEVLTVGQRDISVLPGEVELSELSQAWPDPKLWDVDEGHMYYMRAQLRNYGTDSKLVDEKFVKFGFREVWVEGADIYMNGRIIRPLGDWDTRMNMDNRLINQRYECARAKMKALREINFLAPRMTGITPYKRFYDAADDAGFPIIATGYAGSNFDPGAWDNLCAEWSEYIKCRRNHPSIILWSVENEGVAHSKANSIYMIQRKLDQLVEELDSTRPYYHDGHCRYVPEDPGAMYENGDLCGTAPISGGHYTCRTSPMSKWMHEFDRWRKIKPFIYGEAGTFDFLRDVSAFVNMFYGGERGGMNADELGGRVTKMVIGSWRSYGVSGIFPLGVFQSHKGVFRHKRSGITGLKWNDYTTPGVKPINTSGALRNPYEPKKSACEIGEFGRWVGKAFSPLLVTLYRDLRHNFYPGDRAVKPLYVVNDSKTDLDVAVDWQVVRIDNGKKFAGGNKEVTVPQGQSVKYELKFKLPRVNAATKFRIEVVARSKDGKYVAEDDQELSVYSKDPIPRLEKQYYVYDSKGTLTGLLKALDLDATPLDGDVLAGNAAGKVLLVAPYAVDKAFDQCQGKIDAFIKAGGVVLVFNQNCSLPSTASSNLHGVAPSHPMLQGLAGSRMYFWNTQDNLVTECGITMPLTGVYMRPLRSSTIFEMFHGDGVLLGCNLLLAKAYDSEPEARLLLHNTLRYVDGFQRKARQVYFHGKAATAIELKKMGVSLTGLALTEGTDVTAKELKALGVPLTDKALVDLPSLAGALLMVDSAKALLESKSHVDKFVEAGGILFVLPQSEKSWGPGLFGDAVAVKNVNGVNHQRKISRDPMIRGCGSLNLEFVQLLAVKEDSGWHSDYAAGGKSKVYGLAWQDAGEGKIVIDQIPYWAVKCGRGQSTAGKRLLICLLANLGATFDQPESYAYMAAFSKIKEKFAEVREMTEAEKKKFHFVNLKFHMNAVCAGKKFDNDVLNTRYRKVPLGEWVFAGVPFYLVDADNDELLGGDPGAPNNCIVLKGERLPIHPLTADGVKIQGDKGVEISRKAKRLHFLHASTWAVSCKDAIVDPNHVVVTYHVRYADGTSADCEAQNNLHIRDWWIKERNFKGLKAGNLKAAKLGWGERMLEMSYALATMWVHSWDNPHPGKEIAGIDIISANKSVPIVFGITLEE